MKGRRALVAVATLALAGASWVDPHAKAREAARLYAAGDFEGATTKYNEALVDDPDSTLLHYNLGASAYRQGKYDDAIRAYSAAVKEDPESVSTYYFLGYLYKGKGRKREAIETFRRYLDLVKDTRDADPARLEEIRDQIFYLEDGR